MAKFEVMALVRHHCPTEGAERTEMPEMQKMENGEGSKVIGERSQLAMYTNGLLANR
jgi:hypothetical protein